MAFRHKLLLIITSFHTGINAQFVGVDKPPEYSEFTVRDCFKDVKASSAGNSTLIPANHVMKGTTIWRTIALDVTANHELFSRNAGCTQISLIEIIKFGLFEKNLKAFENDAFENAQALSAAEILSAMQIRDSSETITIDANGNETKSLSIVNRFVASEDIVNYLIKEDWIINTHSGRRENHIIAIAPLVREKTDGLVVPLFWLYYREWATLLGSFAAGNIKTEGGLTFRNVLERGLFRSQISKESNISDRTIKAFRHGSDVRMESELIKERVRNSESDLFQH